MTGQGNPGLRTVVVGVGNEFRRDDGAGPEVIARLRALQVAVDALTGVVDGAASSHSIGLGDTVELARVLGRLPERLTVLAVVGCD
jgi:hydrogenase maturation protease